ncbi:hypothetical protein [Amycolatopsis rubida]|uniref:Uncharacterized protein n=1 Tax=Amycolatopsis rubida TaxID=112413 RepID=A0A1I5X8K4_9PSEU|nr:hypothetical protein [Amycolatopsis rubida]SFQ28312.1 hypothetical protein SAMN05421854_11098 [Amycolatopsis rubida]
MARDKRVLDRMEATGECRSVAVAAIRAQDASRRSARVEVVMHSAEGWPDDLLAALEKEKGSIGFNLVGHSGVVSGDIESAEIWDDENGERIEMVLSTYPDKLAHLPAHRPLEVVLSKASLTRLERRIRLKNKAKNNKRTSGS